MITTLWWNKGTLWSNYKILCKMLKNNTKYLSVLLFFDRSVFNSSNYRMTFLLVEQKSRYLSEDFQRIMTAVINVDSRGRVGTQEVEYAKTKGLNLINV